MGLDAFPLRSSISDHYDEIVKFVGGSAAVTKVHGKHATVTYVSTGLVDLVWSENPGVFIGLLGHGFEATTQADLKGYSVVAGVFNTTTYTLRIAITGATDALVDLAALQWLSLTLGFHRSSV